jgi:hypothetical protein
MMFARIFSDVLFVAGSLSGCGDDEDDTAEAPWTPTIAAGFVDTPYPCQSTADLLERLKIDPYTGRDFEMRAAKSACRAQGLAFTGAVQCTRSAMQVKCE